MAKSTSKSINWNKVHFVGIDLGNNRSAFCALDRNGKVVGRSSVPTSPDAFRELLPEHCCRIAIEVGAHSPWVSRLLEAIGHEVYVANPRRLKLIHSTGRKNDELDAEHLARLVRLDPALLAPIRHRSEQTQADLAIVRARCALVETRTKLINTVRGLCRSLGVKLPACSAECFARKAAAFVPASLEPAIKGLFESIEHTTASIRDYDRQLVKLAEEHYPETERMKQVRGVGPLTALVFALTLECPERFRNSRIVGAWLGLTPKQSQSGDREKRLGITKQGDEYLRCLLVNCAHYILGPFGEDCDLRRHGEKIAARGGPNAKKRAVPAVARKLAVLMHSLWKSGDTYVPLGYEQGRAAA